MSTKETFFIRSRVSLTVLVTLGWLVLLLCWVVFAWSQASFFQILVGLGIITLLYAAITGVMWVVDQGYTLAATILTTLGWMSLTLYWIGFAWSQYTFLQNSAILVFSFLACGGIVAALLLAAPSDLAC